MSARWWLEDAPLAFTWDLWYGCNYRCSYCWWEMEGLWEDLAKRHRILPPTEWDDAWRRVHDRHGEVRIDVLGGEPLAYPRAEELFVLLSRRHRLVVTTNLSLPADRLERLAARLDPERVHFSASFHPEFAAEGDFREKLALLKERGFDPNVLFVTWPPFLDRLRAWRDAFQADGYPFSPMVFQGAHAGRAYPDAYTEGERELIFGALGGAKDEREAERDYRLDARSTLGKPCHAGRVYANVKADGSVFRCGQDAFGRRPMGNLFDAGFRLHDAPKPCPYERCSCLEFKYLDELRASGRMP